MATEEQSRHYFWFFFGVMGVVFFWAGTWDGLGTLPYLENPWISLSIGLIMVLLSKTVFAQVDPVKKAEEAAQAVLQQIHLHPRKHEFHIKYHDKISQKELLIRGDKFKSLEKGFLLLEGKGQEEFIPIHRVTEVLHQGKTYQKLHS